MSFPYIAALSWRAIMTEYASSKTFNYGQLGMTEDGSLYRLCKAGAAMTNHLAAKINYYQHLEGVTGSSVETTVETAIVSGDTSFTIDDATNARAADYYKNGIVVMPTSTGGDNYRRVWKSSAESSDVYTIYVTAPFTEAYALDSTIHVYPSPYRDIRNAGAYSAGYEQFACMIEQYSITSGYFFWGKVRGPHWCWVNSTWPGAASEDRECVFHTNGTIEMADESWGAATSQQRAGHLMFSGNYGDALIFIQIE